MEIIAIKSFYNLVLKTTVTLDQIGQMHDSHYYYKRRLKIKQESFIMFWRWDFHFILFFNIKLRLEIDETTNLQINSTNR